MRFVYFLVSSSLLIGLVLLIRRLLRRQLCPGMIYALWLIPMIRLFIPFGSWEFPVFGTAADFLNAPYEIAAEWLKGEEEPAIDELTATRVESQNEQQRNEQNEAGTKIYDAVDTRTNEAAAISGQPVSTVSDIEQNLRITTVESIAFAVWLVGSVLLGIYVFTQNRKLRKIVELLTVVEAADNLNVCISDELKVPCLVGVKSPVILVTREAFENPVLYKCVLQHELAHYHQKDHVWNAIRIFLCVLYWWNPLVWFAARCAEEDAELACDERALENQSMEERKAYGYALLQMLENAQDKNRYMIMATSMSGTKNSMRRRIREISQKTSTKRYLLIPITLVLLAVLVLGCGMPTDKSWIKPDEWTDGDNGEELYFESEYEYSLKENIKSQLIYFEVYQYGELVERNILAYGAIEDSRNTILMRHEVPKNHEESRLVLESNGIGIEIPSSLSKYPGTGGKAYSSLESAERIEIIPEESLILNAIYKTENGSIQSYDCKELSGYTELQLQRTLKDNYAVGFCRVIFSELPEEELFEKYSQMEYLGSDKQTDDNEIEPQQLAVGWAEAFVGREIDTIKSLTTEEGFQQLIENGLVEEYEEGEYYFGWSSPWPMFGNQLYEIVECDDSGAKIRYYASFSIPHVYIWDETLEFENVNGTIKVVNESNHFYEVMHSAEEFYQAYPNGTVTGTMMDYFTNGLGEFLNRNALENPEYSEYQSLFSPETAALELLNISKDGELVYYTVEEKEENATVQIYFLEEGGKNDMVEVTMWQPYGEEGIWIPQ